MSVAPHSAKVRHHPAGSPPPDLKSVLHELRRASRKGPILGGQQAARGIVAAGCRETHNAKGAQDDYVRFLMNFGILIPDGDKKRLYFDAERGEEVLAACQSGRQPSETPDPAVRLTQIKQQYGQVLSEADSGSSQDDTKSVGSEPTEEEPMVSQMNESQIDVDGDDAASDVLEETASASLASSPGQAPVSFALFLTELERDVWESFITLSETVDGERRVGVPTNAAMLKRKWCPRSLADVVTTERYAAVVERFLESGIFAMVGPTSDHRTVYRFVIPWEAFVVELIRDRHVHHLPPSDLAVVRGGLSELQSLRRAISLDEMRARFEVMKSRGLDSRHGYLFALYPDSPKSASFRLIGMLYEWDREAGQLLAPYPGFEHFLLVPEDESCEAVAFLYKDRRPNALSPFLLGRSYDGFYDFSAYRRAMTPEGEVRHPFLGEHALSALDDQELEKLLMFYEELKEADLPALIEDALSGISAERKHRTDRQEAERRKREEIGRLKEKEKEVIERQQALHREMEALKRQIEALQQD